MSEWESDPNVYYDPNTNSWVSSASAAPYNPTLQNPPTTPYVAPGPVPTWAGNFEASAQPPTFDPNYDPWASQAPQPAFPSNLGSTVNNVGGFIAGAIPPGTPLGNTFPASSYNPSFGGIATAGTPGNNPLNDAFAADAEWYAAKQREIDINKDLAGKKVALTKPAKEAVFTAQTQDVEANRALLTQQLIASQARQVEFNAIQAAKNDTANILGVAKQQRQRDTMAYRYNLAGLPTPLEIKLPPGYTGPMPPGTVARLMTLQDILTEQADDNEKMRQFAIEAARIHTGNTGLNVTVAQINSGRVALTLDEAEAAAELAGLHVAQTALNRQKAGLPPAPGLEWDETTNMWTDKNTAAIHAAQAKEQQTNQILGFWGDMTTQQAASLFSRTGADGVTPVLSEADYRSVMNAHGIVDRGIQDKWIEIGNALRASSASSTSGAFQQFLVSQGGAQTPPAPITSTAPITAPAPF